MSGHKKYPHVPCRSIHLRLDRVLEGLECHLGVIEGVSCECEANVSWGVDIEELRKVIEYRGNTLSVQKRRKGFTGEYMTITRENGD